MWAAKSILVTIAVSLGTIVASVGTYYGAKKLKGVVAKRKEQKVAKGTKAYKDFIDQVVGSMDDADKEYMRGMSEETFVSAVEESTKEE